MFMTCQLAGSNVFFVIMVESIPAPWSVILFVVGMDTGVSQVHDPAGTVTISPVTVMLIAVCISACEQLAAVIVAAVAFETQNNRNGRIKNGDFRDDIECLLLNMQKLSFF